MNEKNNYIIQILDKVKPEKIIEIIDSQPKKNKENKRRILYFLGIFNELFFLGIPIYFLYFFEHNNMNENLWSRIKRSYYSSKFEFKIGYENIANQSISLDLYKEISKYFEEDDMVKIVKMKLKNEDFLIDSIYRGKSEKEKINHKEVNVDKIKKLLSNLNKEKYKLENEEKKQEVLINDFTKSLYEK